jgi:hypothetical protein
LRALRLLSPIVGVAALCYVVACTYLWYAQRQLIFIPEARVDLTPADVGLQFVEVPIPVGEGSAIAAWWLPSADAQSPVLLYLHGNDGNLARELHRLRVLHGYGLPILAIDYRGYGRSSGPFPSEAQVYDDALSAWSFLVHVQRIDPRRVVIHGHSLGAAIAVDLALRRGPACGVVLESAFTSMADMARLQYPWVPVDLILDQHFDVLHKIDRLGVPIVLVHGSADREVPFVMSERLYAAAHTPKRLVLVNGAGHEDAMEKAGEPLQRAIAELAHSCAP